MGSLDWWDTEGQRHFGGYMLAHSKQLQAQYPGRIAEAASIVRRYATAWAKECREIPGGPPDGGKTLWQYRARAAEQEMARVLTTGATEPVEQIGLL